MLLENCSRQLYREMRTAMRRVKRTGIVRKVVKESENGREGVNIIVKIVGLVMNWCPEKGKWQKKRITVGKHKTNSSRRIR